MDVADMETHRAALGDLHSFRQIAIGPGEVTSQAVACGPSQETGRQEVFPPGLSEAIHRAFQ
ncbi:MAG TPA: hypothetical protein VIJ61_18975, partial [Thermoanaerobaculia bacterium]